MAETPMKASFFTSSRYRMKVHENGRYVGNAELPGDPHGDALGRGRRSVGKPQHGQQHRARFDTQQIFQSVLPTGLSRSPRRSGSGRGCSRIIFDPRCLAQAVGPGDHGSAALRHDRLSAHRTRGRPPD